MLPYRDCLERHLLRTTFTLSALSVLLRISCVLTHRETELDRSVMFTFLDWGSPGVCQSPYQFSKASFFFAGWISAETSLSGQLGDVCFLSTLLEGRHRSKSPLGDHFHRGLHWLSTWKNRVTTTIGLLSAG